MNVERFVAERRPAWVELDELVRRAGARIDRLPAPDVLRLGALYRASAADLATARSRFGTDPLVPPLEAVVGRARQLVYARTTRRRSALEWLHTGFWRRVRERPRELLLATLLLWGPLLASAAWAHADPERATRAATVNSLTESAVDPPESADRGFSTVRSASFSGQIFTNNIRVALLCLAGGMTAGLLTVAVLVFNGLSTGLLTGLLVANGGGDVFFRLVLPHGLLELSLITVAGAAGLRVGWAIVAPGHRRRTEALATEARAAAELALGGALWLIPTGLVEGFVTPRGLSLPVAAAVGAGLAGLFWALVLWRGREPGTGKQPVGAAGAVPRDGAAGAVPRGGGWGQRTSGGGNHFGTGAVVSRVRTGFDVRTVE